MDGYNRMSDFNPFLRRGNDDADDNRARLSSRFTDLVRYNLQHLPQGRLRPPFFLRVCTILDHRSIERDTIRTGMSPTSTMISAGIEAFSICAREASS